MNEIPHFEFGRNWLSFLNHLSDSNIAEAQKAMLEVLGPLEGTTFLDVGSGSGLHSLIARKMGANVVSFDYDPQSVACTEELKQRYFPSDEKWKNFQGSVLDEALLRSLGTFDIVYSWGVLHHTGNLWKALDLIRITVKPGGCLFLALYNDQGFMSRLWWVVKRIHNLGPIGKALVLGLFIPPIYMRKVAKELLRGKNPIEEIRAYEKYRGMSYLHDWLDWLGGWPFEVSKPGEVIAFYQNRGFELKFLREYGGHGNNEFLLLSKC